MAESYSFVLADLGRQFLVVGRSKTSAKNFAGVTGIIPTVGGVSEALAKRSTPKNAIVAVNVDELAGVAMQLIEAGTKRILLEKPGGLSLADLEGLQVIADRHHARVWIAYNRRYYASVLKLSEMLVADGGATSIHFEFTEWSQQIKESSIADEVKRRWFLANSSHVVDLAFHLCGYPKNWERWISGSLDWHPSAARFCGAGQTDAGVLFSYLADWEAPGRWGVEILTRKRRLILRPMEKLQQIRRGSLEVEHVEIEDGLDLQYKPGLYRQTMAFLNQDASLHCPLNEQIRNLHFYWKIAGYDDELAVRRE